MWPETGDEGTDNSDSKHSGIHQVGVIVLSPDETNGTVHSEEKEGCRECKIDGGFVHGIVGFPHFKDYKDDDECCHDHNNG
ncbi:hypothetical protein ACFL5P_02365 [candidate division KSB1 bacterium]